MRPFLGRVPLKASGSRSLGQVEFTDPWGGFHRVTVEPPPIPPTFKPFNAPFSEESRLRDEREELYHRKIEAKRQECEFLDKNAEDYKDYYEGLEDSSDEDYQAYSHAVDAYNECLDKIDALIDEMNTAPVDFGVTPQGGYEWPAEVPEPTGRPFDPGEVPYVHHPEDYPPVASVDDSWPEEVPQPPSVVPEPEPPELVEQPPTVASMDWRTSGCPAGTQRLVRGGMCVSSGLVSTGLTTPSPVPTTPFTMGRRIPLSPGLGVRALGLF
jgi:hypothetical protein